MLELRVEKLTACCLPYGLIFLAAALLCVFFGGPAGAGEVLPCFKRADAINNYIYKKYLVKPDGSYSLRLDLQAEIKTYRGKKERADFRFPYNSAFQSVQITKARTVLPSGKILQVSPKEVQDILDPSTAQSSIYSRSRLKVINFPGVEAGSRIELTLELNSTVGFWARESFRLSDPTRTKTVEVQLPLRSANGISIGDAKNSLTYSLCDPLVSFKKVLHGDFVSYLWTGKDLPERYTEPGSPYLENQPFCLLLSSFSSWSAVADFFEHYFHPAMQGTGFALPQWARECSDPDRLYQLVLEKIAVYQIPLFKTAMQIQSPGLTLSKGYGSSMDLAMLFCAILRQQGTGCALLLGNSRGIFIRPLDHVFSPGLFDQLLVMTRDRIYLFTDKNVPPGVAPCQGSQGLSLREKKLVDLPVSGIDQNRTRLDLSLGKQALYGECWQQFLGRSGVQVRQEMRYLKGRELEIKVLGLVHQLDPLARLKGRFQCMGMDSLTKPVDMHFKFVLPTPLLYSWGGWFFPLPSSDLLNSLSAYLPKRHYPLAFPRDKKEILQLTMLLPEELTPVLWPHSTRGSFGPLSWKITAGCQGRKFVFRREVRLKRSLLPLSQVAEFLTQAVSLSSPRERLLVLR